MPAPSAGNSSQSSVVIIPLKNKRKTVQHLEIVLLVSDIEINKLTISQGFSSNEHANIGINYVVYCLDIEIY